MFNHHSKSNSSSPTRWSSWRGCWRTRWILRMRRRSNPANSASFYSRKPSVEITITERDPARIKTWPTVWVLARTRTRLGTLSNSKSCRGRTTDSRLRTTNTGNSSSNSSHCSNNSQKVGLGYRSFAQMVAVFTWQWFRARRAATPTSAPPSTSAWSHPMRARLSCQRRSRTNSLEVVSVARY